MSQEPIAILATGMVTGVGLNAPSSCAAIRCAYDNFQETRFMDQGGEWIMGCEVPLEGKLRGREKLLTMAAMAIQECTEGLYEAQAPRPFEAPPKPITPDQIPLLLCVAEEDRPGRLLGLDASFLQDLQTHVGQNFHRNSLLIRKGRVGGIEALRQARELLKNREVPRVLVVGVDSYLSVNTLIAFEKSFRLKTSRNSDGFIPGEASACLLIGRQRDAQSRAFVLLGTGEGIEEATSDSGLPLKANGLTQAIQTALKDASCSIEEINYRITDLSGGNYGFKEASLALQRTINKPKPEFDVWTPADCFGEVGAAIVPCLLASAKVAHEKNYAPGPGLLCHVANDKRERSAAILRMQDRSSE